MKRTGLREARRRARLTQAELADRLGRPQSFISKLERGELAPSHKDALALASALRVDIAALRFPAIEQGAA